MIVRLAALADATRCNQFYNIVYQKRRSLAQWKWEFATRSFPAHELVYVLAEDEGKIVGTQALIPIQMIDEHRIFWSAKSEETLVDPAYRGRQIFEKMYDLLKQTAKESGIECIWGFTPATKAFSKIGFESPGKTAQIFFPFTGSAVLKLLDRARAGSAEQTKGFKEGLYRLAGASASLVSRTKFALRSFPDIRSSSPSPSSHAEIRLLTEPPIMAGDLCSAFVKQWGGCTIYRDTDYLRWRLFENPHVRALVHGAFIDGHLCGWIAYSMGDDGMGYLVDLIAVDSGNKEFPPGAVVRQLLSVAVRDLRKMGALGVRGWQVNDHPFDQLVTLEAKALGFYHIKRGHEIVFLNTQVAPAASDSISAHNWYISRIFTEGLLG